MLYKTTIIIWTEYSTSEREIDDLAREAIQGDAYCSKQHVDRVEEPEEDSECSEGMREFFW